MKAIYLLLASSEAVKINVRDDPSYNSYELEQVDKDEQYASKAEAWTPHSFYSQFDTTDFEQDFHEAVVGKIGERKEIDKKLNKAAANVKSPREVVGVNGEDKFVMKYNVAGALERGLEKMTPERRKEYDALMKRNKVPGPIPWQGPPQIDEIQLDEQTGFLGGDSQLTWQEHVDDKLVKDESEWHDVDFEWTKTHPDWGMDENVKHYFAEAEKIKQHNNYFDPFDTDQYVDHYKYWSDQIRINNHTTGMVTPKNPELTPTKTGNVANATLTHACHDNKCQEINDFNSNQEQAVKAVSQGVKQVIPSPAPVPSTNSTQN